MDSRSLLNVRHLSVEYASPGGTIRAVRDVSVEISAAETLAVVGETGSGKSTLALAILGLLDDTARWEAGAIAFDGCNIQARRKSGRSRILGSGIGAVFQDARSALNPVLTVRDHLVETLRAHRRLSKKEAAAKSLDLLREVGIPASHAGLYPFELSGGISQRVGIALSICNNPRLLIADEPTSALDPMIQMQILGLLLRMRQRHGVALLLISHDLDLVARLTDRIAIMYHGRIVESGERNEVLHSPAHPYTRGLLQCRPGPEHHYDAKPMRSIPCTLPLPGQEFPGCAFAPRCGRSAPDCVAAVPGRFEISETHWVSCLHCGDTGGGGVEGHRIGANDH